MPRPTVRPLPARWWPLAGLAGLSLWLSGCAASPLEPPPGSPGGARFDNGMIVASDGTRLPLRRWGPEDPEHVALALHGFNDHAGSMQPLAQWLIDHDIAVYAFDQRGFGATPTVGHWAGDTALVDDAQTVLELLAERHPGQRPFLIGKSMGGAVALLAATRPQTTDGPPEVAGTVLIAPAVWDRGSMPWYQRLALWLGARVAPGMRLSGEIVAELDIRPTDNPEVLAQMRDDPLVLRDARIDTLDGLTTLMGRALEAADHLPAPSLTLYGARDDIVPRPPVAELLHRLDARDEDGHRTVLYPDGFHMLTRYTRAADTFVDIITWIHDPRADLPSGHERGLAEVADELDPARNEE
ncbi:MAG: alpha/beta hydrolase [Pseudomonadota bacterium]